MLLFPGCIYDIRYSLVKSIVLQVQEDQKVRRENRFFFFFFFFEFEVYCPLFTQQDIMVLQEHYIGDPGSI